MGTIPQNSVLNQEISNTADPSGRILDSKLEPSSPMLAKGTETPVLNNSNSVDMNSNANFGSLT